jgi:hypothetical protein
MSQVPTLVVTNPLWLRLFNLGFEDPGWGKRTIDQHTIAIAIYQMASLITDEAMRKEFQSTSSRMVLLTSQHMIKEAEAAAEL